MNQPVIEISHLNKMYKMGDIESTVLSDVSLSVQKGEFVAIMGPSGSGKSTLMHILGVLDLPSSGSYLFESKDVTKLSDDQLAEIRNQRIGFVFQAYNLLPRTSALENVMLPMEYAGVSEEIQVKRAQKYLEIVGLANRMNHTPNRLSGGQMQRVAIARALVMNPSLILADEPTGNIASDQADEIMSVFESLNKHEGHTIVMITHEMDIAEHAQRIIHIRDGKIVGENKSR